MSALRLIILMVAVTYCFAAGGGGGGSSGTAAFLVEGGDDVRIMKVPKKLTLVCNITAEEIDWYKDGERLIESDHYIMSPTNLTITPTEAADVGKYKCQSTTDSTKTHEVDVVTLLVKNLPLSTTALEGDQFSLTCDADGIPMPTVSWYKDDVPLDHAVNGTSLEYRDSEKGLANATIVLSDITQDARGHYTCLITNHPSILYNTTSNVRVKDIYAALWPFLGIVAEVVILCLVIFIYERHRSKMEFEESEADNAPEPDASKEARTHFLKEFNNNNISLAPLTTGHAVTALHSSVI